ncbi:MAG TPA: glycosyltransferase, partial [Stellaceae bacterium]|nr:glycosyltransferase [Stellaceae bacterium]
MTVRANQRDWADRSDGLTVDQVRPELVQSRRLKVLLVSHAFPPANSIGAVRVGKLAKYFYDAGHDVRVVAAPRAGDQSLPLEIPADRVVYQAGWKVDDILDGLVKPVRRWFRDTAPVPGAVQDAARPTTSPNIALARQSLARHYYALLRVPDSHAGWIKAATLAGRRVTRDWRPDIVVASGPPNSGLVAASRIARACGAPWVAELRDLWVDNSYYGEPTWRWCVDYLIERRILGSAAGLVSVTPRWAESLRRRYPKPTACILNGYVEEDFPPHPSAPPPGDVLSIVYTGSIYPGYRDPRPLFHAISLLGAERERVAIHFYGPPSADVLPLAAAQSVADRVFVHDPVAYKASLALQTSADILLLLQWNDEKDAGNIPAKFFEYLGARRPILLLGYERGDLAAMIRDRAAGVIANDPAVIAGQLKQWIAQKRAGIAPVDPNARTGLTRGEQFQKFEQFLSEILQKSSRAD